MVKDLQRRIERQLEEAGIEDFCFETEVIFEEVYGRSFTKDLMLGKLDREPSQKEIELISCYTDRRISGEPLQYIIGSWEFYGMEFTVGKGVLIPRQDTETLIDTALSLLKDVPSPKILDLCSGTGCIPIVLKEKLPDAAVMAAELYDDAYSYLTENIGRYGDKVIPYKIDALKEKKNHDFGDLDLITCNPPYLTAADMASLQKEVKSEPATALYGDEDGLKYYRIIPKIWKAAIKDGGHILFEIGCSQAQSVMSILAGLGYEEIKIIRDFCGRDRAVLAKKSSKRQ